MTSDWKEFYYNEGGGVWRGSEELYLWQDEL